MDNFMMVIFAILAQGHGLAGQLGTLVVDLCFMVLCLFRIVLCLSRVAAPLRSGRQETMVIVPLPPSTMKAVLQSGEAIGQPIARSDGDF